MHTSHDKSRNEELGRIGEDEVYAELLKVDSKKLVFRNVILGPKRHTAELDFIVVTDAGVYVIEVKNFGGEIDGARLSKKWYQSFEGRSRHTFYNPMLQNTTHVNALRHTLLNCIPEEEHHLFHSMVVFSDRSEFLNIPSSCDKVMVIHTSELAELLSKSINYNRAVLRKDVLDINTLEHIENILAKFANPTPKRIRQHVRNVLSGRGYLSPFVDAPTKNSRTQRRVGAFWAFMRIMRIVWALIIGLAWIWAMNFITNI